ncbi:YSIRK-type signal peptide-containing protein [Ligilactobacillus murinus]|uniref:mucin-binding protein n=1 Tax=Ligilactobacillus murinus TaxID=1622 RepID=UPI00296ACFD1|nr:YSIRK-type signal peptide-containing protein [Ligilactobacillus murinus]WOY89619.1 YSIRK-type signal peptide-containing protein [Ligilactobacillus murinus]
MLSRNNNKLLIHKLEPKKQRFAIRKISVGVASVLIGFTFAGFSGVSADEATTTTKDHLKTEATAESSSVPTKEVELTSSDEAPAKEAETTSVADDKAQVAEDTKEQTPAQAVTAEETSESTINAEKQTVAPTDENEASETQTFNVEKQAEPQANVDLTDSKVAYAAAPTQAQDQQEEGFSVTDPDYSKYTYKGTKQENNLQTLIKKLGIDYKNSEYVFQWIASTNWNRGIIFTVDRGRDADGNVILTGNGSFNAYEYSFLDKYHIDKAKTVIQKGQQTLNFGKVINDEYRNETAVDHFYANTYRSGWDYYTERFLPIFVGGHSGIESNTGDGYTTVSIYTPQVVEQKAKIDNGKVYKTQTGLTGQNYTTGVPKSAKVEEGKFLYAENSEGTMSEFHKGVVLVNNYHDGVTVRYTELDDQGTMQYEFLDNRGFAKKLYNESTRRNESRGILHVGQSFTYEGDSAKYYISNPYVQQTTDITYEYHTLGSVELYDENGNCLGEKQYVNDENDAAKASLPKVREKFSQGDIEYTLVTKEDLPSDLSRSIKYIYRGIETKVTHDTYTLTTKFVDEDGNELKAAKPQMITWTTTTKRDIHTNEITKQTFVPSKTSYMAVNSPVIAGYYATTPGLGSRKAEQKNATQEIVYHKLGNIIAKDSQGNDLTKVPYENDANDATKIKEIVAPTIEGYHVKSEVVQPSDPGQDTVLNYGKDIQDAQIKYWDETAHKYITDDQGNDLETIETGAHNTKISHKKVAEQIHALKAKGYEYDFANQGFSTVYFDDDDSKLQTFTVKLMHGTKAEIESKQIAREIIIHHPNQQEEPKKQTATLTRNVTRDKVTGDVIETGEWNPGNFDEVEVTPHKGYKIDETPDEIQNGKVVGKLVTSDEEDGKKIDVKYIPLEQHALVKYVDDNTGALLDEEDIQGVTDAAIEHTNDKKTAAYQANGYELVSDELAKAEDPHFNAEDEPQVFEVHLKHRVEKVTNAAKLEKTVTRTIIAEVPNGKKEETQTVKFTRTGAKDLVTGKTTWSAWSPAQEFAAYTAPVVPGYTPSKATVERATVTANDKDTTITITYTANAQEVLIKYVDVDNNNEEVKSQSLDGVTDQTVDTKYEVPANYEEVADQNLPSKVTFKANGNEPIIVKVQHKTTPVKVGEQETQNVVTRKITVHKPDGTTKDISQTATFTRTGTKDLVTGEIAWNAWSPAQEFDAYTAPKVDGYTADKSAEKLTVNANDKIAPVDIYYTADAQEVLIKYVDVDENNKEVASQSVSGKTDQTVDVNYEVPANYEEVADQDLPGKVTFKANGNESIIVKVQHKHQDVTDEYKNDVHKQDKVDHTVTRTVVIKHPHAADETHTRALHFTRQVTRDMATGHDTFGEWIPDTVDFFEGFAIEPKASDKGYTHDKTSVDRLEHITGDTKDPNETVGYTANDQKAHVHYIDDTTGKKLEVVHVTGKTDEPIKHDSKSKVQDYLDKGYELVSDGFAKAGKPSYNAEDEDQHFEVHLKHAIKDVTDQHAEHEVKHTVNRHIIIKHPHAADETHTQSIHFTRQVTRDMTTGQDTFGEWIPENADFFEEFAVPTLASDKGYTPKKTKVDRLEHITGNTRDQREIVEFAANDQKAHVHYIDDTTGKKLEVVHVTGKTDEPIKHDSKSKVQDYLDKGYELVSDGFAKAGKPSYNAEDEDQHFEVHLKHALKDVTDQHAEHEVKHTVNRHIIIKHPHAADETHTQSIHFTRQVTRDMTTGQDTFGEWIPENADFFEEFAVPTSASDKGYTPKKTKVDRLEHITGNTRDQREIVEFAANDQKAHVHYIDDTTGKKLEVVHVTGKTDEPIKHDSKAKVQDYLNKGYELVSDDFAKAGKPSYNAEDEDQHFEVHLKHGQKDVTDEYKQDDKRKDHVDRTIKREVVINHPKEDPESYVQTAHFTRNVTRDTVTGEDKPGEWIPEENDFFEEVPVSLKDSDKGYTPEKTKVDRLENISADTPNQKEVVEFTPNEQHALVKYVDDSTGNLLDEEDIQGVTDAAIEHTNDEKIAAYQAKGYELVSDELADENDPHFNAEDEAQVYTVHLKHGSKVVKADPSNADSQKEVKRTIIVNAPDGTKTTKVQTVVFTRDGSKDLVTGKISYPDWDEIATKAFSQDDVPQYLGYTSMVAGRKQTTIAARNVRPTDADQVIEVSYVARPSQQVITYQDENGNQIGTQVITGHTDETVKLVPVLPDGWELLDPDSLPENVTFAPEENPVLVITVKRTATEDSAKTEKTGENTELAEQEVVNDTTDVTTNEKNEATLPQMGESDSEALAFSLLGLVTAAFSLFYFGKERRKTDN